MEVCDLCYEVEFDVVTEYRCYCVFEIPKKDGSVYWGYHLADPQTGEHKTNCWLKSFERNWYIDKRIAEEKAASWHGDKIYPGYIKEHAVRFVNLPVGETYGGLHMVEMDDGMTYYKESYHTPFVIPSKKFDWNGMLKKHVTRTMWFNDKETKTNLLDSGEIKLVDEFPVIENPLYRVGATESFADRWYAFRNGGE